MSPKVKAYCNEIIVGVREIVNLNPLANEHISQWVSRIELSNPFTLADFAAAMTTADDESLQRVLEADNVEERLAIALELLTKEKELAKIRKEINKQVEDKMSKSQREYFLREQLKSIKAELGMERDDKDELIAKYSEKIKKINENNIKSSEEFAEVIKLIDDELKKLSYLGKFNIY
jgi:ATP-dependent Lon protease